MQYEFELGFDRILSGDAPEYQDAEISVFLTKAQQKFINTKYSFKGNKNQEGFEFTEKRRKDLNELMSNTTVSISVVTSDNKPTGAFFDLPADFMWAVNEEADVSYIDCGGVIVQRRVSVSPIREDEYNGVIKNPFKKPCAKKVLRMDFSSNGTTKRHELIAETNTSVINYYVRYLRYPQPIITAELTNGRTVEGQTGPLDCELNESTHRDIIDLAIEIALETVEDKRLQSNVVLNNENE